MKNNAQILITKLLALIQWNETDECYLLNEETGELHECVDPLPFYRVTGKRVVLIPFTKAVKRLTSEELERYRTE